MAKKTSSKTKIKSSRYRSHLNVIAAVLVAVGIAIAGAKLLHQSYAAVGRMCEVNGAWCVGSESLDPGIAVSERYGRDIIFLGDGLKDSNNYDTGHLAFNADTKKCLKANGDGAGITIGGCSGTGIRWSRRPNPNYTSQIRFRSVLYGQYLAGHNCGCQFRLEPLGLTGWYYQFIGPSI